MDRFSIAPCTLEDAPAIARNNMSAFWTDSSWVLSWSRTTLEKLISSSTLRYPHNLLKTPIRNRHQKAIDKTNGKLVGYIRWNLPDPGTDPEVVERISKFWPEARCPVVDEATKNQARRDFEGAWWETDPLLDGIDIPVTAMKERILAQKPYVVLEYLAVHPDNWGQGIGTFLVESGIKEAEKLGYDIFVLAMKGGLKIYERAGFKIVDSVIQDDRPYGGKGEYAMYCLVRETNK